MTEAPGITVFCLAAKAVEAGLETTLVELLEDQGHEALLVASLDSAQSATAASSLSDNEPLMAIVTIDLLPMRSDPRGSSGFDNPKIAKALERAAYLVDALATPGQPFEPLTATRNSSDAWKMVRLLFPGEEAEIRRKAHRMRADFETEGAIRDLTREGRRAKVELVKFEGELAVRKTYRSSALRCMEREIEVFQRLSPTRPEIPRLLHRGSNHVIIEHIANGRPLVLEHHGGPPAALPLKVLRALAEFIKACVKSGFDPIDLRASGNVMMTDEGLKVIDFELWRRCSPGTRPESALCLTGIPPSDGERPRGVPSFGKPYASAWYPLTLLPIESFLYDPAWLQRLKRAVNLLRAYATRLSTSR